MNKDKAIQLLERLQDPEPYEPMLTKDAYDAIQMAIDALSADGDTISRKAAIEAIDEIESEIAEGFGFEYEKWRKYFCDLPPAQPEPKRGKWIDKGITGDWQYQTDGRGRSWHEWQCDQCKDMVKKRSFYCPNCGADMREVTT